MTTDLRRIGTQRDILGECPLWDERASCLWWIDIRAPALRRFDPAHDEVRSWPMPELLGSIALTDEAREDAREDGTEDGGRLLLALSSRLALFDPDSGAFETVAEPRFTDPDLRFNDGRCDPQGRFWVGSMNNVTRGPEGCLYRFDLVHGLVEEASGICIPNSLAFSPDGRTMYFADSLTHRIDAFDYDPATGKRGAPRLLAEITPPAFPDGSCIDAEGCLWNAEFHGARLVRYTPGGAIDRVLPLPVQRPTCCSFGGADLRTLYITTTSQRMSEAELAAEPLAGALLALDVGVAGLAEPRFKTRPHPSPLPQAGEGAMRRLPLPRTRGRGLG